MLVRSAFLVGTKFTFSARACLSCFLAMSKLTHAVLLAALFQLCAAEAQCSARCGSEVGFTSSNGPDMFLSYDGARLTVPGYCRQASCDASEDKIAASGREIAALKAQLATMATAHTALKQRVDPEDCSAGKYSAGTTCEFCSSGRVQTRPFPHRMTSCESCPQGTIAKCTKRVGADGNNCGATSCESCSKGEYYRPFATEKNTWGDTVGVQADCVACKVGRFQAKAQHLEQTCAACSTGKFSACHGDVTDADGSGCRADKCSRCATRHYFRPFQHDPVTGATTGPSCVHCPAGRFMAQLAHVLESCQACAKGKFALCTADVQADGTGCGADSCSLCVAGRFFEDTKVFTDDDGIQQVLPQRCTACDVGQYSSADSMDTACSACKAGKYSECQASANPKGKHCGARRCQTCNRHKFYRPFATSTNSDGVLVATNPGCANCPIGQYGGTESHLATTCNSCAAGKYSECHYPTNAKGEGCGAYRCLTCNYHTYYQPWRKFLDDEGNEKTENPHCKNCPVGQFGGKQGHLLTSCKSCAAGKYSECHWATNAKGEGCGAYRCLTCNYHRYYQPWRKYIDEDGNEKTENPACKACPVGRYGGTQGHVLTSCKSCAAGKYSECHWATNAKGEGCGAYRCLTCPSGKRIRPWRKYTNADGNEATENPGCV